MTISSTDDPRAGPFNGNGSQTAFPFEFKAFSKEDLLVVRTDADGLEFTLVLDSDYSVTLNADQNADPGGSITYPVSGAALPAGETLTIASNLDYTQETDITNGGGFYPQVIEDALDRNTMLIKQVNSKVDRALQVAVSTPDDVDVILPPPSAQKIIGWNDTATGLVNRDITDFATVVAFAAWQSQTFDGDGVTTQFVLSSDPGNINNLDIAIGGVTQTPAVDFTLSGTTLTFTTAPPSGTDNIFVRWGQALPQGAATADQVSFNYALTYAPGTVGYALKQNRIDVRLLGVDNTGATDCSAAMAAALALGVPLAMRGTFKLLSKVTYTGAVDILGEDCTINSDVTCFEITDGDGSRIRNLSLMPITTPYTLLRNTTTWVNAAGDVVQSLEGYQPSALDTDIWASLSGAIQNQSANKTINPGIIFKSSTGLTARRDVQISGITGRAVLIQLEGYSDSEVSGCDFGAGPREGINFLNGQTLARGARNRIINNRVRYASQCGILWWAQDELECYGNDSRLNGESNYKSYQYDGTNTTDVISKRCRIFGNHSQDAFYDGFDLQSYYNVADPGVYTANQCYGNTSRNCRHTTFTINGEGDTMSLNYAERSGSHGISVKSKRATVTGNSTKDCCAFPAVHAFQIFDMLVQGDGINSSSNNIANATAAYTYNYLHSGVTGADPTTGDEGFDFGNRCSGGPDRITVSKNIPTYLITSVVKSITAATYTVAGTDAALSFFTSATCTVTLPSPAAYPGRVLSFRNTAAFAINSASANVSPIGGGALSASILAATVGKWCELQSDGTNWLIMSSN
jgi:hypothetical protein